MSNAKVTKLEIVRSHSANTEPSRPHDHDHFCVVARVDIGDGVSKEVHSEGVDVRIPGANPEYLDFQVDMLNIIIGDSRDPLYAKQVLQEFASDYGGN